MKKRNVRRKRHATLVAIFAVIISGLGALFALGFHSGAASRSASDNGSDPHPLFTPSSRGGIFDRNLRELAVNARAYSVYAHPLEIENSFQAASILAGYLKTDKSNLLAMLRSETAFVSLGRRLDPDEAERIRNLNLKGIYLTEESCRFYPGDDLAAQVIGFTDTEGHGIDGLEFTYDHILSGSSLLPGTKESESHAPLERIKSAGKRKNVILTLDRNIQALAEKQLEWITIDNKARAGIMIVMDTCTGAIMAMANYPSYNPNTFWEADALARRNRAITDTFELGNLIRCFEEIAVLEAVPAARSGSSEDETVENEERIAERPSPATLYSLLTRFGLGAKTGISLPGENPGVVQPYNSYQPDPERLYRGEGIHVTPLQLVRAFAATVNGGILHRPHLVARISDDQGNTLLQENRPVLKQACNSNVSGQIRSRFVNGGSGATNCITVTVSNPAPPKNISKENEQVLDNAVPFDYIRFWLGSAPADRPQIAALIVLEGSPDTEKRPDKNSEQRLEYITRESLRLAGIAPHEKTIVLRPEKEYRVKARPNDSGPKMEGTAAAFPMPDLRGKCVREVLRTLHPHGVEVKVSGSGVVVEQWPAPGARIKGRAICRVRLAAAEQLRIAVAECGISKPSCECLKKGLR